MKPIGWLKIIVGVITTFMSISNNFGLTHSLQWLPQLMGSVGLIGIAIGIWMILDGIKDLLRDTQEEIQPLLMQVQHAKEVARTDPVEPLAAESVAPTIGEKPKSPTEAPPGGKDQETPIADDIEPKMAGVEVESSPGHSHFAQSRKMGKGKKALLWILGILLVGVLIALGLHFGETFPSPFETETSTSTPTIPGGQKFVTCPSDYIGAEDRFTWTDYRMPDEIIREHCGGKRPVSTTRAPARTTTTVPVRPTSVSGVGQRVVDLKISGGGLCIITSEVRDNVSDYDNDTNFSVLMVDPQRDVWTNEIARSGSWETTERFEKGQGYATLEVKATGSWKVTASCRG